MIERSDYTRHGGVTAMTALLDRCPDLDAVFVASDLMASGALQVLRERGRRVPDDVAVVGFDDLTPIAEHTDPPLTTVHQDIEGMGRLMARLLFSTEDLADAGARGTGSLPSSVVTPTRLVVRQSA
jgi:DNA-binding LacI/PurR family transcriptional regulator